jgi:hypothetical protein
MLNKGVDEVLFKDGVAWGIKTGNEVSHGVCVCVCVCVCVYSSFLNPSSPHFYILIRFLGGKGGHHRGRPVLLPGQYDAQGRHSCSVDLSARPPYQRYVRTCVPMWT